jgi:hypothetical protein
MIPTRARPPPPYIYRVPRPIKGNQPNRNKQKIHIVVLLLSTVILLLSTPNSTLTVICCSSFIPVAIEGLLAGIGDARTHQGTPAPTGSLLGRSLLDFCGDP